MLWWIAVVNPSEASIADQIVSRVSILVVVDCSRQQRRGNGRQVGAAWVSILVVVDCSRQRHSMHVNPLSAISCFNPCCGGLQSSTFELAAGFLHGDLFQSLLWWIAVVNHPALIRGILGVRVSILVVVDCSRQPSRPRPGIAERPVSILVVVDCSRQHANMSRGGSRCECFNPCCGGLQSSTVRAWMRSAVTLDGFNPCCGGLQSSTGQTRRRVPIRCVGFQSLLWWIAVVNSALRPLLRPANASSFNPCCGGLQSSTRWTGAHGPTEVEVSILVVVDCSRQP